MTDCDVLVIGGGPGGAATATLLAARGWRVVLAEKARHPRFHIGESLLPLSQPLFERLGVAEAVARIGMPKCGAEFVPPDERPNQRYYFADALDRGFPMAFQVKRAELDELLFRNAEARGAQTLEETEVATVAFPAAGPALVTTRSAADGERCWRARQVVDASGRDTFLACRGLGRKHANPRHRSAAVFAHFEGARLETGRDRGNIAIYWFDHGWLWLIPFRDDSVSIGAVCAPGYLKTRRGSLDEFLRRTIERAPELRERMRGSRQTLPAQAAGNYSYQVDTLQGERFVRVGDAFAFVDPVFSSGVHLALHGAVGAAEVLDARLRGDRRAARLARRYEQRVRYGLRTFSWFIYRINQPAMRRMFLAPNNTLGLREGIVSLLAGDLYRQTPIRSRLLLFKAVYASHYLWEWRDNQAVRRRRRAAVKAA